MAASSCAPPLLAQRSDGPGEPDGDRAVEQSDVEPELERVRCGDAEQVALDESALDRPALRGCVAGTVGREPLGHVLLDALACELVDQLGALAALCEADRAQAAGDERRHHA